MLQVGEHGGEAAECARGEQSIVRREDEVAAVADLDESGRGCGLQVLVVAGQKLEAQQVVAGDEALDLVEDGEGIEGAELGLQVVGGEPDSVAVGLAGLRAAGLAHVGAEAPLPKGTSCLNVRAHLVGEADDHLEVGADAGAVCGLRDQLEVAVAVGDGAGLFVEVRGGKDDVGEGGGLGEEHVLNDDEGVLERGGVDAVAGDGVRADDVEGGEFASAGGLEDLEHVETGCSRGVSYSAKAPGLRDRSVAGEHVGEQAHVGCAARVGVVGEEGELCAGNGKAEVDERFEVAAAKLGADEDEELLFCFDGVAEGAESVGVGGCAGGGCVVSAEVGGEGAVAEGREMEEGFGLAAELDLVAVGDVEAGAVVADVGADVPRGAGA